jgi:hypothetical protein
MDSIPHHEFYPLPIVYAASASDVRPSRETGNLRLIFLSRQSHFLALTDQSQARDVVHTPARLDFNDAVQGTASERVGRMMEGKRYATSVGMVGGDFLFAFVSESRPFREQKQVDELLRSEFSNNQPSYRDSDNGFVNLCHPRRQRFSILQEGFDYHLSDFLYIAQSFFSSLAPGGAAFFFKLGNERAPHIFVRL